MKYIVLMLLLVNSLFSADAVLVSEEDRVVQVNNYELSIISEGTALNIGITGLTSENDVEVYLMNMHGGLVKIIPVSGSHAEIDISDLSYGFYFIKARFSDGLVISKAITIP